MFGKRSAKPIAVKRREPEKLSRFLISVMDIIGIQDDGLIMLKNGYFAYALSIPGVDIQNFHAADQESIYAGFARSIVSTYAPIKIVSIDTPPNYTAQKQHLAALLETTSHPHRQKVLNRELAALTWYEENTTTRSSFIFAYGKTPEETAKNAGAILALSNNKTNVKQLDFAEAKELIGRILNPVISQKNTEDDSWQ